MNKYTTIQIKKQTRDDLQEYCKKHGYSMSRLIDILIHERIHPFRYNRDDDSQRTLKSIPKNN